MDKPTQPPEQEGKKIFGSASSFGQNTGFAGVAFNGSDGFGKSAAPAVNGGDEGDDAQGEVAEEEECQAEFKPVVQLEEVETTTGEEHEETLLEYKSKLYRFDKASQEWKERGVGMVKILKHQDTGRYRLVMREDKTLKIRANHNIMPLAKLQEHAGNEKAWVWSCPDFAEGEQKDEMFCIRFGTVDKAKEFQKIYEEGQVANGKTGAAAKEASTKSDGVVDELAEQLEKSVKVEKSSTNEEQS